MQSHDLTLATNLLNDALNACVEALRLNHANHEALNRKRELNRAIRILRWAQSFALAGDEKSVVVPEARTKTPSSEFRVLEDHETDDRKWWTEVETDGERLRLYPGDLIVRRKQP